MAQGMIDLKNTVLKSEVKPEEWETMYIPFETVFHINNMLKELRRKGYLNLDRNENYRKFLIEEGILPADYVPKHSDWPTMKKYHIKRRDKT